MAALTPKAPHIVVFDSGLGGLTSLQQLRDVLPAASFTYIADTSVFPYGDLEPERLEQRVLEVLQETLPKSIDALVIACNTAATIVLKRLRSVFPFPIIGTVPAVKPAAALSKTGVIAVLATRGTIARAYTEALINEFASHCWVERTGSSHLARLAEEDWMGIPVSDAAILAEIAPCFVDIRGARTDVIALSCTHYPLLLTRLETLAPWPVKWLDSAPAIARRTLDILGEKANLSTVKNSAPTRVITTGLLPSRALNRLSLLGVTDFHVADCGCNEPLKNQRSYTALTNK